MKILYVIFFSASIQLYLASIVLKQNGDQTVPESNKLQIQFSRSGDPIQILTNHKVSSLKADTEVKVDKSVYQDALEGEDEDEMEGGDIYDEEFDEQNQHGHGQHIHPTIEDHDNSHIGFLDDIQQQIFDLTNQPQTKEEKHLNVAYSQLGELEDSLKDVLYKTEGKSAVMMDPKVLQTLVSYLEHLDYIHKQENGGTKAAPPKVPDHFRSDGIEIDLNEPKVTTQKKISEIEEEIEAEVTEKTHEKDQAHEKLHEKEEEEFNLEKEIEGLRAEIDNLKQTGEQTNQEVIKQKEEEIKQLEEEIQTKKEEEDDIKTEENLDETEIEVEQAEETVEKQDQDPNLIEKLDEEKDKLEDEEKAIQDEEQQYENVEEVQERLAKIDEQLSELLESQPESSLINELEEEKKRLLIKEEELKKEIGKEKNEEEDDNEEEGNDKKEEEGDDKKEEEGDDKKEEEGDEEKLEIDQYTQEEMDKVPNIDDIGKLELKLNQIKKQLTGLYKDLPKSEKDIPSDIVTEYKSGLLLYQELQNFNGNFSIQKKQFMVNTTYLTERLAKIQLDFESVLKFYKMHSRYEENIKTIKKTDSNFIMKEEEIKVIINQFATHIDSISKNVNSIKNIIELIESNLEPIDEEKDEKDEDIDMIQKVELTFKLMPTLLELKTQMETAIKEAQIAFTRVNQKTSQLDGIMQSLIKISRGELKEELTTVENSADKKNDDEEEGSLMINIYKLLTMGILFISFQLIQNIILIFNNGSQKSQRTQKEKKIRKDYEEKTQNGKIKIKKK